MIVTSPEQSHLVFQDFLKKRDLEGILSRYAPDAVIIGTGRSRITGLANIRAHAEAGLAYVSDVRFEPIDIIVQGDLALERLNCSAVLSLPSTEPQPIQSVSTAVLRRQPDGNWLITIDDPGT